MSYLEHKFILCRVHSNGSEDKPEELEVEVGALHVVPHSIHTLGVAVREGGGRTEWRRERE